MMIMIMMMITTTPIVILMMVMMMMIIIIVIALKGSNLLTAPRTVSSTHAQVARAQSCANHVQHIECRVMRRDSSDIKFDRV